MCGPKGYGFFFAVLVENRVSIIPNRVWFLHTGLGLGMLF